MASKKVKLYDVEEAFNDILNEYKTEVAEASYQAVVAEGKDLVKDLRSRVDQAGIKGTGAYKKSFAIKSEKKLLGNTLVIGGTVVVYAKSPYYRLTHLLEHGHKIVSKSGKVTGTTKAYAHWAPAEKKAVESLEKRINEII